MPENFAQAINRALREALADPEVLVCGQLIRFGTAGITAGLHETYPKQVITYPVSEALMNASAMGLALAGARPVMVHERFDFAFVGPDALINHIPIWAQHQRLPLVILVIVGKGAGQGPQHSKNFASWFRRFEGWAVCEPESPEDAYEQMFGSIFGTKPVMYVVHREHLKATKRVRLMRYEMIRLCGASPRHEQEFYEG